MKIIDPAQLDSEILALGTAIFQEAQQNSGSVFSPQYYTEKFMEWGMKDEEVKVSLFRFVDVLPNLSSAASVVRHVQEYFLPLEGRIPEIARKATGISPTSLTAKVAAAAIKKQVKMVAERFIVGETATAALPAMRKIRKRGMAFTVDLVGEAAVSEAESASYLERYLELLEVLARESPRWPEAAPLVLGHPFEQTPINISVKLSALYSQTRPVAAEHCVGVLTERLATLLASAKAKGAGVYVDMEDASLTSITLETFKRALDMPEFRDYPRFGIVLQAYLRRTEQDVDELIEWLRRRGTPIAVRLVKGAYWDTETILAIQHGWPIPVWQLKANSDASYESLTRKLLGAHELIMPAFASHNIRSLCHAVKVAELSGLSPTQFEIQTLYGMADTIKRSFADRGYLVREYAPVGELIPGMGYLVRRLLENTSNEGFLRQGFHENERPEVLLRRPVFDTGDTGDVSLHLGADTFRNTPLRDFTLSEHRAAFAKQINELLRQVRKGPLEVHPIVRGEKRSSDQLMPSVAPEDPELTLAEVSLATQAIAEEALQAAAAFYPTWRDTPVEERADILIRAADLMEDQRDALAAAIVLEAGKPWSEADADVAEAIDFLRFYAQDALRLFKRRHLGDSPGEQNLYFYEPRGVTLVICPWNFPLAIPCGMFAAALVTGNCALLKPSEQTPLIARLLFEILQDAGVPADAAAFLPGIGEEVGAYLADHEGVSTTVFTGSKEVGLKLLQGAGERPRGGEHIKRIIAEMGGKNAVIIDDDADLDEAVKGVIQSAFAYQGQKCSACSRAIVVAGAYDRFLERLTAATKSLVIGRSSDPSTYVGPVIDSDAYRRINQTIADSRASATLVAEGVLPEGLPKKGYYIKPTVFADVPIDHPLFTTEIFGPVLAVVRADNFEHALELALKSEYGLTGGLFSRSPGNIRYATERFNVGNLYINRSCTGAMVMRQPFGGAKMSGVGSKAGGPDYLLQFVIPRTVTENTVRRGFAPMARQVEGI